MKILIMGGAGFVGRNLLQALIRSNFPMNNIIVIDKNIEKIEKFKRFDVNIIMADLSKNGEWVENFKNCDIVINLAAQISAESYEQFQENNVEVTINVLEACKKFGINKIIHFSSAAVLSVRKDSYATTKKIGEELVISSGINYIILQPSLMYGPTDDKNIGYLINFSKKFPFFPIPGHGKWPRQPVYIDDVCQILIKIIQKFPNQNSIYIINGKDVIYFDDMIKEVHNQLGGFKMRIHLPIIVFKMLMVMYQKIVGKQNFTSDQINSLTAGDVFPNFPWWDEFDVDATSFKKGVSIMLEEDKEHFVEPI